MTKKIRVATSPITNTIFAGTVLKDGRTWGAALRQDVTMDALVAVAEHAIRFGAPVVISGTDSTPLYEITVRDLRK